MLSLPLIEPRDSHKLWYTPSQSHRNPSSLHNNNSNTNPNNSHSHPAPRRNANRPSTRASSSVDSLAALVFEERALRLRKQNIASFGYSWIRPAGYPKTMMGIREEELEREEGVTGGGDTEYTGEGEDDDEEEDEGEEGEVDGLERDLDGDIPDADEIEIEGLVEEGEEGLADEDEDGFEEGEDDEDGLMGRDLDDDVPDGFDDGVEDDDEDEDEDDDDDYYGEDSGHSGDVGDENGREGEGEGEDEEAEESTQPSSVIRGGRRDTMTMVMGRDLDGAASSPPEHEFSLQQEWEHTDSDEEYYDNDTMDLEGNSIQISFSRSHMSTHSPASRPETVAERAFLERWSGRGGADESFTTDLGSSGMLPDNNLYIPRRRSRLRSEEDFDDDQL